MLKVRNYLKENCDTLFFILLIVLAAYLLTHHPGTDFDSAGYIRGDITRPPLDTLFIRSFAWASQYQFEWVMWVQGAITFFALIYAKNRMKKKLLIPNSSIALVYIFTLITILFHYQIRDIDPEGLTFPLFIFIFFITIECFQENSIKKIITLSILVSLLILLRSQFYFYYAVYITLIGWIFIKKSPTKYIIMCVIVFTSSALLTDMADRSYHYFKNGYFMKEPFFGMISVVQPLFLSNQNAYLLFQSNQEKLYVKTVLNEMNKRKLYNNPSDPYEEIYRHYNLNYNKILKIVFKTYSHQVGDDVGSVPKSTLINMNRTTQRVTKILFLNNMVQNIKLYFYKIMDANGGILFISLYLIISFLAIKKFIFTKNSFVNYSELFVTLSILVSFFNEMLVDVVEPNLTAYYCYTQFLLYCLGAYFVKLVFIKND